MAGQAEYFWAMSLRGEHQAFTSGFALPVRCDGFWRGISTAWVSRVVSGTLAGLLVLLGVMSLYLLATSSLAPRLGADLTVYREAADRWLSGGSYFYPEQLAGPYTVVNGHVLYPPVALVLFVPFTVLPAVLWWAVPLVIIAACVIRLRPSRWGWVGILALACWPYSVEIAWPGNPTIWITAILAAATRWPWASAFGLLKPSLFPFALAGIRTRAWWIALAIFAAASLLFLPMWFDWLRAVTNARGPFSGPLYSLKDLTWMAIPTVAWGSRRGGSGTSEPMPGIA